MTSDPLDDLLATIDALEDDTEVDPFPWTDAARWCPAVVAWESRDPYGDLPAFDDDGAVVITDAARPWVVVRYTPPWWAAE